MSRHDGNPARPVATYSIVARDKSGSLGVAVQSHWFSVGSVVPYVEAGIGAIAVQSVPHPAHGRRAIELLRSGAHPAEVQERLLAGDSQRAFRQTGIVDRHGRIAVHTGSNCMTHAGHRTGDQYTVQANLMERDTVWDAMAETFEASDGDLAERLLLSLDAAQVEGGDVRGKQSAAIVVTQAESAGHQTADHLFDLRVEDHHDPLGELRRLVALRRVYIKLIEGDDLLAEGDMEAALHAYRVGTTMQPDSVTGGEAAFWTGITLAAHGRVDEGVGYLQRAQAQWSGWVLLVPRLTRSGILPSDDVADRLRLAMGNDATQ